MTDPIIIIGTGLAGYQLAREFRKLDKTSSLLLITQDDGSFYPKPQLSTAQTQKKTSKTLVTSDATTMANQLAAEVRVSTTVNRIDLDNKTIEPQNITFKKLVLACGADVMKIPLQGNATHRVLSINHLYHYAEFESLIQNKKHITILGTGLIGCEFANDLSNAGFKVHLIAPDKTPLERFLPEKIGVLLQKDLEKQGISFHLQTTLKKIDADNHILKLELSNGDILRTEFVLSAIGLRPHIDLAKSAEIKTNRGILVNRFLETNIPDIYAIGDCAEVEGHVLPFITPILNCARALAKTLTGERTAVDYPAMPITVKTPAHPIVICPPLTGTEGEWQVEVRGRAVTALFFNKDKQLLGFVLTNEAVKERANLVKQIPNWLV